MENATIQFNKRISVSGEGMWSEEQAIVTITKLECDLYDFDPTFGEMRAYFDPREWNVEENGLIYTDPRFISVLRAELRELGFSKKAADDVNYSEQGMQGFDYVSLDIDREFTKQLRNRYEVETV